MSRENSSEPPAVDVGIARRKLDAFLVDNDELEALNARLCQFNLFRVLRAERVEIRHSNVLAWLLTPGESHGLGDSFLRRFLSRLLMENETLEIPLTPAQIELMTLDDVEVYREWHSIDIVARSAKNGWCLLVENKIESRESSGQLARYKEIVEQEFPRAAHIPVFLSLEGDDPSTEGQSAGYVSLSHADVLELAERITSQNKSRIPSDAGVLLTHYLDTLRRLTMQDEGLVHLCKAIYRKHREAIDLIVQYGSASQVVDACEAYLPELTEMAAVQRVGRRLFFVPKEMADHEPEVEFREWKQLDRKYPIQWWFYYHKKNAKLQVCMEVGPVADPELRSRLLKKLREVGLTFWDGAFREEAKYTRVVSESKKLRQNEDGDIDDSEEHVQRVAASLWKKGWEEGKVVVDALRHFDWPS